MQKRRIFITAIAALLLLTTVTGVLPISAVTDKDPIDYSRPGATVKTVSAAEILERYLGTELTTAERSYLVEFSDTELKYNDGITTADMIALYEDGKLEIHAHEYSYTAENSATVTWIPATAELHGETKSLVKNEDGSYVASFTVDNATDATAVNVTYTLDLAIDSATIDRIANFAYSSIPALKTAEAEKLAEYESLLAAHKEREDAYNNYLAAIDAYKIQLDTHNLWKIHAAYAEYEAAMKKYSDDLAAHLARERERADYFAAKREWQTYLDALDEYNGMLAEHEAYLAEVAPYRAQLEMMEFLQHKMTKDYRSIYRAVYGSTVDSVLAQRDSLTGIAGVPDSVIDLAESATVRLRTLFADYFSLTTDVAKYHYYRQYYNDFKNELRNLFVSLDFMYRNGTVRGMIKNMSDSTNDRNYKFQVLLAQLFIMVNAIWDEPVKSLDPSYVVGSTAEGSYKQYIYSDSFRIDPDYRYTVDEVIPGEEYISDTDAATPLDAAFPTEVPHPGEPPTAGIADPGDKEPEYIPKPDEPDPVDKPEGEAPPETPHPGEPPAEVAPAGDPPAPYVPDPTVAALLEISDDLAHRDIPENEKFSYNLTKTVEKRFINVETVTVDFYDTDGVTLLYTASVDRGTAINYAGTHAPTKPEDDRATYTFDGWVEKGGTEPVDLSRIDADTVLYPHFRETVKLYPITFITHKETVTLEIPYGTQPTFDGDISKPEDELYKYIFDGWDKELVSVTGSATYTAKYIREYILPTTEGGATVTLGADGYLLDFRSTADKIFAVGEIIDRAAGKHQIIIHTRYYDFTLTPEAAEQLKAVGACRVFVQKSTEGGRTFISVVWHDSEGNAVTSDARTAVSLTVTHTRSDRLKLSYTDDAGEIFYASYTLDSHKLSFKAVASRIYTFGYEYRAETINTALASVFTDRTLHYAGDTVTVSIDNTDTVRIKRIYYKTASGNTVNVEGNSFIMPDSDVTVYAVTEYITYKITFMSEGSVLSTVTCKVGELPELPESPKKASDSEHTYEFLGWSPTVVPATADAVYVATYEALPPADKLDTGRGITLYMLINLAAAGAFGIFAIAIPATVLNIVTVKKFRKTLLTREKNGKKTT